MDALRQAAVLHLRSARSGRGRAGRVLFHVAEALRGCDLEELRRVGQWTESQAACMLQTLLHYDVTCERARQALRWWTRAGMRLRVAKDVRRIIARLLWDDKAAWS